MTLFIRAPAAYAGNPGTNLLHFPLLARQGIDLFPLLLIAATGLIVLAVFNRRLLTIAMIMLIAGWIGAVLPGQGFAHYAQLFIFPSVISTAWAIGEMSRRMETKPLRGRAALNFIPVLVVIGLVVLQAPTWLLTARQRAIAMNSSWFVDVADVAAELKDVLNPNDEQIFSWTDEPQLYVLTDRRPVAPALWRAHTLTGPQSKGLSGRTTERVKVARPDVIILWAFDEGPTNHPILEFVRSNYRPMPGNDRRLPLAVYVRRGSNLEARVFTEPPQTRPDP